MSAVFAAVLQMSLRGALAVILVATLNWLLKRFSAPAFIRSALWLVVLARLLLPFSFSAAFSLFAAPSLARPITVLEQAAAPYVMPASQTVLLETPFSAAAPVTPTPTFAPAVASEPITLLPYLWAGVAALFALHGLVSYARLRRHLSTAIRKSGNIFESEGISSPFVAGFWRPRIYLPQKTLAEAERSYIIRHEQIHIRRGDHLLKPLMYAACCLHWFNPLAWLGFALMSRDMEESCDEAVLKEMGLDIKAAYSASLLALSAPLPLRGPLAGSPLAFGELNAKQRVRQVLAYQKPVAWVTAVATLVVVTAAVLLLANPRTAADEETLIPTEINEAMLAVESNGGVVSMPAYLHSPAQAGIIAELCQFLNAGERLKGWFSSPLIDGLPTGHQLLRLQLMGADEDSQYAVLELAGRYYRLGPAEANYEIDEQTYEAIMRIYQDALVQRLEPQSPYQATQPLPQGGISYSALREGDYFHAASHYVQNEAEFALAERIIENFILTSAAWPGLSYEEFFGLPESYRLHKDYSDEEKDGENYLLYEQEGIAYIQRGFSGARSRLEPELFDEFAALFTPEDLAARQAQTRNSNIMSLASSMLLRQAELAQGWQPISTPTEWYGRQAQSFSTRLPQGLALIGEEAAIYDFTPEAGAGAHAGIICLLPYYQETKLRQHPESGGERWHSIGIACSALFTISDTGRLAVEALALNGIEAHYTQEEDGSYFISEMSFSYDDIYHKSNMYFQLPQDETILNGLTPEFKEILATADKAALQTHMENLIRQWAAERGFTI